MKKKKKKLTLSCSVYPLLTVSLSSQSLSKNKNLRRPYFLTKLERQINDNVATPLKDNCTMPSYGLSCLLSQLAQANMKWEMAGTTMAKRTNMDQDRHVVQIFDWSTHIHRRYDLKLCNSSCACETHRINLFLSLLLWFIKASLFSSILEFCFPDQKTRNEAVFQSPSQKKKKK